MVFKSYFYNYQCLKVLIICFIIWYYLLYNLYILYPIYSITNSNIYKLKGFNQRLNMKIPKYIDVRGMLGFNILNLLNKKKLCGDELADIIGNKKYGKLTPGTIYPALKYLRENRLIIFKQKGRKKIYSLTKKGLEECKITKKIFKRMIKEIN